MRSELKKLQLSTFEKRLGKMSAEEAMKIAIDAEETLKDIGPFDPAYHYFAQSKIDFEKYAYLLDECV